MNKNRIIILTLIIALILTLVIATAILVLVNSELILNDVAGVHNVNLTENKDDFSLSQYAVGGKDIYHNDKGDIAIHYNPSNTDIIFFKSTGVVKDIDSYLNNNYSKVDEKKTIAGVKGYSIQNNASDVNGDISIGDYFIFVIDNKIYRIGVKEGSINSSVEGIEKILLSWLKASGFNQTWDYPQEIQQNVVPKLSKYERYVQDAINDPRGDGTKNSALSKKEFYEMGQDKYY